MTTEQNRKPGSWAWLGRMPLTLALTITTFWGAIALGQDVATDPATDPEASASAGEATTPPKAIQPAKSDPATEPAKTETSKEESSDLSVILTKLEESMPQPPEEEKDDGFPDVKTLDTAVNRTYCATCGGGGPRFGGTCSSCGTSSGRCIPGRGNCAPPCPDTLYGRVFGNLYECLCCPDPCYEPAWVPAANASFFTDYARTRTVTRLRWDHGWNMRFPDRSEYFWAKQNLNTQNLLTARGRPYPGRSNAVKGLGPAFPLNKQTHRGIFGQTGLDWDQLYYYQEAAAGRGSLFIEMPYRSYTTDNNNHGAGFSDLNVGTKAMLVDCEMMQLTFQFKAYTPTGQASRGFGTGHVSLEPSLLMSLRLAEDTYFQGQIAEWIPLGGNPAYAGAIIRYSGSLNTVLFRTSPDSPVIGTLEGFGMTFQDGAYTDPFTGPRSSSGGTYFSVGPGIRHSICDRVDYGGSLAWSVTDSGQWASPWLRLEMRILY